MTESQQNSAATETTRNDGWLALALFGMLMLATTGCATLATTDDLDQQTQRMASLNADVQTLAEERQKLIHMLEASRMETAQLAFQVKDLTQRLDLLEGRFAKVDASYKQALDDLNAVVRKESESRKTAIQDVVTSVSSEIAKTANQLQEQQRKLMKSMESTAQGEYVVQKGDTLAAIAKAFNVSLSSLQKANGLKSTSIRVGQKLIIPKS